MSALFGRAVLLGVALAMGAAVAGQGQPRAQPPAQPPPTKTQTATPTPESRERAEQVLAEARKALGGEKLAAVKTLVASGRTRRIRGNNLVPIEFELFLELPDKYLRADEFPAEDTDPTSSGFNGDALIQIPPPPSGPVPGRPMGGSGGMPPGATPPAAAPPSTTPPGATPPPAAATPGRAGPGGPPAGGRGPAPDPRRARVLSIKQDLARLALGLFADSTPAYPLTFSFAAIAEAPQGKADVLDVKGEGNFALRYFIHSETRLPIMVSWTTPPTNVIVTVPGKPAPASIAPGAVVVTGPPPPAAGASKADTDKYNKDVLALHSKAKATPVEHRLYFADYREVDGVRFPFRLRRAIGPETTEETTFDRYRINARIDSRKFEAVK